MRHYFKTKERHEQSSAANREYKLAKRKSARAKLERELKSEIERISTIDKISKLLAAKV